MTWPRQYQQLDLGGGGPDHDLFMCWIEESTFTCPMVGKLTTDGQYWFPSLQGQTRWIGGKVAAGYVLPPSAMSRVSPLAWPSDETTASGSDATFDEAGRR